MVDEQIKYIALQMQALDNLVTRARSQNAHHYDQHIKSLEGLSTTVKASYTNIGSHFNSIYERLKVFGDDMSRRQILSQKHLASVGDMVHQPLADLRANISNTVLEEYQPTGHTPQRVSYLYPTELPQTGDHGHILAASPGGIISGGGGVTSPSKSGGLVFHDTHNKSSGGPSSFMNETSSIETKAVLVRPLREIDANTNAGNSISLDGHISAANNSTTNPSLAFLSQTHSKKQSITASGRFPMPKLGKKSVVNVAEGRENVPPNASDQSTGRRNPKIGQKVLREIFDF
jgi:kinesin family protein 11